MKKLLIMAEIVKNRKGFKVMKMNLFEINYIGGFGICDWCGNTSTEGYYIAVLNQWYCPKCYNEWYLRATYYPEDAVIENRNFINMQNLLEP